MSLTNTKVASQARTRSRSWAGVAALAAVVALAACTPVLTSAPPKRTVHETLHVDVVGDSLIRQAAPDIERRLGAAGFTTTVASEPRADLRSPFLQARLAQFAATPGDVVVIATANNDAIVEAQMAAATDQNTAQWAYRNFLGDTAHRFGDRCVVVVNAKENISPIYNPTQAMTLNANITDERARRANMVIANWGLWGRFVPADQFMADLFHFGPDPTSSVGTKPSADAFAGTIEGAVQECAALLRP